MRPVNLIPEEKRGVHGGIARTGPLVYILVGSLAVLLIGVVMLVLTSNKISDRESEIAKLDAQKTAVTVRAASLAPYVSFEEVASRQIGNITDLADARFDWVRVIRQLSLVLPPDSKIGNLTASSGGGGEGAIFQVTAPSMNLTGCARGQDGTAAVVTAMKQIDGVTRVGLAHSGGGKSGGGDEESSCEPGQVAFELTVTFDEAPGSPDAEGGEAPVESAPTQAESTAESTEEAPPAEESSEGESVGETASSASATGGTG